ncbi:hypothetical protein AAG570_006197 [Ranatra chinensis]|uniref:Uncharacterized protein n=1 Tax=Ranatra chinensis TaxID=642074 RepID=A0ABD0YA70_9HEMI
MMSSEQEDSLVTRPSRHTGAVRALDFNSFQTNLLATGACESEIFIWDLNQMGSPMTPGVKPQPYEDVVCLAWNKQVQHILASAFGSRCIVWDLRKNEPIIKLTDSTSRVRWKDLAWHPDVPTQLCLASEDDTNPVIQLWDLRFATSPLRSLQGHTRGVLSLAWCSHDSDLMISCAKDNKILCWNPNSNDANGEMICEIPNTQQWIFEVDWCPRNPALVVSCSCDNRTSIYSLMGSNNNQIQTTNKIADSFPGMEQLNQNELVTGSGQHQPSSGAVEMKKPPKWLRQPVGASFAVSIGPAYFTTKLWYAT